MACPEGTPLNQIASMPPRVVETFKIAVLFMMKYVDNSPMATKGLSSILYVRVCTCLYVRRKVS